jgi:hypothetical protein
MKLSARLALLACASLVALVVANTAFAAYTPRLVASGTSHKLGARSAVVIAVSQAATDDPTARISISVPSGYQETLTQAPGTTIGVVAATVILRGAGDAQVDVTGNVVVDDPRKDDYVNPAKNRCAPALHSAVWVLTVTLAGQPVSVPIYIDDVTNVAGVSSRIVLCLAGPIGTPSGSQLLSAAFQVNGVFTNPASRGVHTWSGLFTPYTPNTPNPNPLGTVESRALVPLPVTLTMRGTRRNRIVTLTGNISLPGAFVPTSVQLWAGSTARRLRRSGSARISNVTSRFTNRRARPPRGRFWFYQARVDLSAITSPAITTEACRQPSPAPRGCVSGTLGPISVMSNVVRVRIRR